MIEIFLEVIIAPNFTEEALKIFSKKDNLRLVKIDGLDFGYKQEIHTRLHTSLHTGLHIKKVQGGILVQDEDNLLLEDLEVVTDNSPSKMEMEDLLFALKVVKHIKSNAIVLVQKQTNISYRSWTDK